MQKRPWQRALAHTGGAFVLFAVPAVALAWFTPSACSALAVGTPQRQHAVAPGAAVDTAAVLNQWSDTQTPQADVLTLAHGVSATFSAELTALRNTINSLDPKSSNYNFQFQLTQQSLLTIFNEANAWNNTWKMIGVPGADQTMVQQTLNGLNNAFIAADSALITLQAQELQSGSVMAFTAPTF